MTDLRERAPARAAMEKLVSYRGTEEITELPFGLVRVTPHALMWLRGARGELSMAAQLSKLGPAWTILHSVPVGARGSDIDHVAIGPPGVFPINTKRLIDRDIRVDGNSFRSDGYKSDYLPKSAAEARRVIRILTKAGLSVPVLPIIAISGASSVRAKSPTWDGVNIGVARVEKVVGRLRRRRARLSGDEVSWVAEVLSESAAWSGRVTPDQDQELVTSFRKIDRGVGRLRNLLVIGFGVVTIGSAWWLSNLFVASALAPLFEP